jgi:hypothetical protein
MAHPLGRQAIGLNQPPSSGSDYPFVNPSKDIKQLLGDLFVSFDDLRDQVVYPLRVAWLYGFGETVVPEILPFPLQPPRPFGSHEIIIVDTNNEIVFNSLSSDYPQETVWDDRLLILEWKSANSICRCVKYLEWTQTDIDSGQNKEYDNYIIPENGELQADCWYKLPKRVTSVKVDSVVVRSQPLKFEEGYNIGMSVLEDGILTAAENLVFEGVENLEPGTRKVTRVEIDATAGNGLGVFPGCTEVIPEIRTINKIKGNAHQNFVYDMEGCLRVQRPLALLSDIPREFIYPGNDPSNTKATIVAYNDCKNCCDCLYFAQTYQGLKRQWNLYKEVSKLAEETRDVYVRSSDRWLAEKAAREAKKLRLRIFPDGLGKLRWGAAFCNSSPYCVAGVTNYFVFLVYVDGVLTQPTRAVYTCGPTSLEGSAQCSGPESLVVSQSETASNVFSGSWDYSDPQSQTTINGKLCFPDVNDLPEGSVEVQAWSAVTWETQRPDPQTGESAPISYIDPATIPEDVLTVWNLSGFGAPNKFCGTDISPKVAVTRANPACFRCDCD